MEDYKDELIQLLRNQIEDYRNRYDELAKRTNQLETLISNISMLLRNDMTEEE